MNLLQHNALVELISNLRKIRLAQKDIDLEAANETADLKKLHWQAVSDLLLSCIELFAIMLCSWSYILFLLWLKLCMPKLNRWSHFIPQGIQQGLGDSLCLFNDYFQSGKEINRALLYLLSCYSCISSCVLT